MPKYFTQSGETVIGGVDRSDNPGYFKIIKENRAMLVLPPSMAATCLLSYFIRHRING